MLVLNILVWGGIAMSYLAVGLMVGDWLRGREEISILTKRR